MGAYAQVMGWIGRPAGRSVAGRPAWRGRLPAALVALAALAALAAATVVTAVLFGLGYPYGPQLIVLAAAMFFVTLRLSWQQSAGACVIAFTILVAVTVTAAAGSGDWSPVPAMLS